MKHVTKIDKGGRVIIPAEYRKALSLKAGDEVMLLLDDGELRIMTPEQAIRLAQEIVRRYVPEGRSLSEELIHERREEAARG